MEQEQDLGVEDFADELRREQAERELLSQGIPEMNPQVEVERRSCVSIESASPAPIVLFLTTRDGRATDKWQFSVETAKRIRQQLDNAIFLLE